MLQHRPLTIVLAPEYYRPVNVTQQGGEGGQYVDEEVKPSLISSVSNQSTVYNTLRSRSRQLFPAIYIFNQNNNFFGFIRPK